MIAARQELDLRPQLERLDRLMLRSEGLDPNALTFAFRPLWQLDEPARAALSLSRAQATQVYASSGLWPAGVVARLAEAQLVADGTYPNAAAVFAERRADQAVAAGPTLDFDPTQPRDPDGRWSALGAGGKSATDPDARTAEQPSGSDVIVAASFGKFTPAVQNQPLGAAGHAPDETPIELIQQTCADYISANCKASILRVFPGQHLDQPVDRVLSDAANGIKPAQTAKKLMFEKRFAK